MSNPHQVTRDFEAALCEYTGAKYAVTTTSCTMAIQIALAWQAHHSGYHYSQDWMGRDPISMPKRSYVGVPAAILNAGFVCEFRDEEWSGEYQLKPYPVWDCARRFTKGMFKGGIRSAGVHYDGNKATQEFAVMEHSGDMLCVSFHATKILADSQGGAILHDNDEADAWLRRARFDGRTEGADAKTDQVQYPSWHAYLSPDVAARLLWKLQGLPRHNEDLPNSDYPDLSTMEAFK